jgi:NAD-dependent SIR2 family protein deacetylase
MSRGSSNLHRILDRAAAALRDAGALLIGAGAGMGVDSGLPDFRGVHGFWKAYPPYAGLGLDFVSLANPRWFRTDPELAWGFYGHRLELYRRTRPHAGYAILAQWFGRMPQGGFVYTSNVDGHFQRAGFPGDLVYEVHGAIDFLQCTADCGVGIFPADGWTLRIDESSMRALPPLPACPRCQSLARPNVLMFGDGQWDPTRSDAQRQRLRSWLRSLAGARLVVLECGAGTAVPTVRIACEDLTRQLAGTLIRINPREPDVPPGQISLPMPALEALQALQERLATAE